MDLKNIIQKELNTSNSEYSSLPLSKQLVRKLSLCKNGFVFDKELDNALSEKTKIDGYFEDDTRHVFVISECDEPYLKQKAKTQPTYLSLYEFINESLAGELSISVRENTILECFAYDEAISCFNLSEMISSIVGIATELFDSKLENKQIDLIYLIFDPTELSVTKEVESIYERLCYEANLIEFSSLLRAILIFLNKEKYNYSMSDEELEEIVFKFTFALATQELYPILLGINQ